MIGVETRDLTELRPSLVESSALFGVILVRLAAIYLGGDISLLDGVLFYELLEPRLEAGEHLAFKCRFT